MSNVGQRERATQNRVVELFRNELGYRYLGDWSERPDNRNVVPDLLVPWLQKRGISEALIKRVMRQLDTAAALGEGKTLYYANQEVYSLLRYGVKDKEGAGELNQTVWLIELFDSRMEITNPGRPLVDTRRFLDSPPRSRNEALASFMRRIRICEERGSGIDKVVFQTELYQLPAPVFETAGQNTRSVLFAFKDFASMDKDERAYACYLHCCLKYVNREAMNNTTLRERFGVESHNSATVSRIIKDALQQELIRPFDAEAGNKAMRYVPYWA